MSKNAKVEFGDFQTPKELAQEVCDLLIRQGINTDLVVEPTCGTGAFLVAAAAAFPKARILGWDINNNYVEHAKKVLSDAGLASRVTLGHQDFFSHDWEKELLQLPDNLLLLGNPPWVTNAKVSAINGRNLPAKENFQNFRGIEALTGKSNFDISEWMLLQLVKALRRRPATIAMLCKTSTARKLLRFTWQNDGRLATASLYRIDAKKHFGASVDACLLLAKTGEAGPFEAKIFDKLTAKIASSTLGLVGQDMVFNLQTYRRMRHLEGFCPYQWRSGVKHDCAPVMELRLEGKTLRNKLGEQVNIEFDYLFPLLKCSDLANLRIEPARYMLVTQQRIGDDTSVIAAKAPLTWRYLDSHRGRFEARKSSIYHGRMPFALFGIGEYTFAPWKVAVSGLHRTARFSLIGPVRGKPVLFDDASYFLPFEDEDEARIVTSILNSRTCQNFLTSLVFTDSKRPITVELLQRLNIYAIAAEGGMANKWMEIRNRHIHRPELSLTTQGEFAMETPSKLR